MSGVASTYRFQSWGLASATPLPRSFADLRPPAIHFQRFPERDPGRIGTVQLMGTAGDRDLRHPGFPARARAHVRRNEANVSAEETDGDKSGSRCLTGGLDPEAPAC